MKAKVDQAAWVLWAWKEMTLRLPHMLFSFWFLGHPNLRIFALAIFLNPEFSSLGQIFPLLLSSIFNFFFLEMLALC